MFGLILVIAILGIIVWFAQSSPMPSLFKNAIFAVAAIVLLIYVFQFIGGTGHVALWPCR